MAGKLNLYAIGKGGVNLTKSPIHLDDTELVQAQNAEFDLNNRDGGLRKRGGFAALNSSALNSGASILGLANVPLLSTYTRTLYAALQTAGANTWTTSTDGATWTPGTSPARAQSSSLGTATPTVSVDYLTHRIVPIRQGFIYPGNDYIGYNNASFTAPPLRYFTDGSDFELARIQINPGATVSSTPYMITDLIVVGGTVYFGTFEAGGAAPDHKGRVISLDLTTGIMKQVGNTFGNGTTEQTGGFPWTLCSYRGELFVGLYGISGSSVGVVVRIRPDSQTTWTVDVSNLVGYPMSMAVYKGDLFVGTQGDAGETSVVSRRAAATGTYSTSDSGTGGSAVTHFASLIVYSGKLYAAYLNTNATPVNLIRVYDNTSWSTSLNLNTLTLAGTPGLGALYPGQAVLFGTDLYIAYRSVGAGTSDGAILKFDGTTWSIAKDGINARGYLTVLTVRS